MVAALPQHDPMIEGVMTEYAVGDYVTGNCTSAKSNPPSILAWYINGLKVRTNSHGWTTSTGAGKELKGVRFEVNTIKKIYDNQSFD